MRVTAFTTPHYWLVSPAKWLRSTPLALFKTYFNKILPPTYISSKLPHAPKLYNQISVYTLPAFLTHATFATLIKRHNMYLVYPSSALISEQSIIIQILFVGQEARVYILTRYIYEN